MTCDIASMNWVEFDLRRKNKPLVVIPSGAIEVYGPHLPLASDGIVAQGMARLVAEKMEVLCGPLIPVGYSADLMSFPGTLCVSPNAFTTYLEDICRSLINWGLKDFLFLNTHLGNVALIDQVADKLGRELNSACMQIDWWRYAARIGKNVLTSRWAVGHAGELGTSVLLYFSPELVKINNSVDFIPEVDPWPSGLICYESYREVTSSGVIGNPSSGSREKGETIVNLCVDAIVQDCQDFFKYAK